MTAALRILRDQRLWPIWIALIASLLLLPKLGSYGFWEPQEMEIAARALPVSAEEAAEAKAKVEEDRAKEEAALAALKEKVGADSPEVKARIEAKAKAKKKAEELERRKNARPPLGDWLVKTGIEAQGVGEFGARLPFFLLALVSILGTYFLGVRVRNARAGLLASIVLLACPLFVFQARQITSEMGTMAGGVLMILAAVGLCAPRSERRPAWAWALDAALLVAGAGLSYYGSAFFVGILPPLGAAAFACVATLFANPGPGVEASASGEGKAAQRRGLQIAAGLSLVVALAAFVYFVHGVFSWVEAADNEFSIGGKTLHAGENYHALLGGVWRREGDLLVNFNSLFQQMVFGLFPWICIAPIAMTRMASGGERGSNPVGTRMLFAWAALSWVVASIALRKIGPVQFAAVPAVALGVGVWLDELYQARQDCLDSGETSPVRLAPPLVAFFVLFAGLVVAKDIKGFPAELLSLHLDQGISKFPKDLSLHKVAVLLGIAFAGALAGGLLFWRAQGAEQPKLEEGKSLIERYSTVALYSWQRVSFAIGRRGIAAALTLSVLMSLFFAQVWTPRLSTKLSSKATFSVFHALREPDNTLGIVGKASDGSKFYAGGPFESLRGRPDLIEFLGHKERVFALVKASELCPIHKESGKLGFNYYVVDDSNADKVMLSNRMWNAEVLPPPKMHAAMRDFLDRNPLSRAIVREAPQNIKTPLSANFDDKVELIGIDLPKSVDRGDSFEVTLYYKVLKPLQKNWQIFVHFDGGGVRFQGDHYPVKKRCGTNYWQPGDYIVDRFTVEAGGVTNPKTTYKVWTGFFVGSSGNWENMKALTGDPDSNNRVPAGSLRVQ